MAVAAAQADHAARTRALLVLMQEEHPAYAQCSAAEVVRRRGWVLVELGNAGLDQEAMPVVLEELETGHQPYLLAAAARALRQADAPSPALAPILLRALETLARRDDLVDLAVWGGTAASEASGSALSEALVTLRWLAPQAHGIKKGLQDLADGGAGPLAEDHRLTVHEVLDDMAAGGLPDSSCCALPLPWRRFASGGDAVAPVATVCFEDQSGARVSWDNLFVGQPSVVAFFYTRCDNEQKCSLTVSQLAQVQRQLVSAGAEKSVRLAAITYDPDFDLPHRLRGYAESRGLVPGEHCRVLRTMQGREALRDYFALGVNFAGSVVNRHRIEVFVLDASGRIRATYQRLGWDPVELASEVQQIASEPGRMVDGAGKGAAITSAARPVGTDAGAAAQMPDLRRDLLEQYGAPCLAVFIRLGEILAGNPAAADHQSGCAGMVRALAETMAVSGVVRRRRRHAHRSGARAWQCNGHGAGCGVHCGRIAAGSGHHRTWNQGRGARPGHPRCPAPGPPGFADGPACGTGGRRRLAAAIAAMAPAVAWSSAAVAVVFPWPRALSLSGPDHCRRQCCPEPCSPRCRALPCRTSVSDTRIGAS
uniref:Thioredoxin domain-containing protein n=1 Tax=blood disease bacterium R229 TaxID=741978 RepID=G2ZVV3_9RALS|nr:conserved hypothetical protein [blood disease bacterium R229]